MKRSLEQGGQNGPAQEVPRLTYELWPEAGQMLGLTRNATYEAAKRGDIPVTRFGKLMKVPKAAFDRMLKEIGAI
ncbi:excisionase family DNA binding protein [Bradyrhizobium huanghuaihaiense]|uniref:Excisionase family DNA binding protein n=1 Tax=Bradyrhizobium huanghuaihaiense TaxID=990078 RepID=A0A562RXF2_9BRAD|nr:excisionase family DNA binding protein [Bradyrhizobium huanghuaihaiense]